MMSLPFNWAEHKAELARQREEDRRKQEQIQAEHQAILDRIELERLLKPRPRLRAIQL